MTQIRQADRGKRPPKDIDGKIAIAMLKPAAIFLAMEFRRAVVWSSSFFCASSNAKLRASAPLRRANLVEPPEPLWASL